MKRFIITAVAGILTVTANCAPKITWLTTNHNFGAFSEDDGPVSCTFKYVNTGDEPLQIMSVRASCGCTQPIYNQRPVAPGDTSQITVTYDPTGRPGRFNKGISVDTNTPEKRSKLSISGVVIGSAVSVAGRYPVEKGSIRLRNSTVLFGKVMKPHVKTVFADGYNMSTDSIEMRVVSKPRFIDINFEPKHVGPGEQVSIICYLRGSDNELWGMIEDSVHIGAGNEQFALPFTAILEEDFSKLTPTALEKAPIARLESDKLDFGCFSYTNDKVTMETELHNTGKSTLEVHRIYTNDNGVSVSIDKTSIKKGKKATITVNVEPSKLRGDLLNARIHVISNDPEHPSQILRAVGEVR